MNNRFKKLSHSIYECKYHIVFCPKYRYRILEDVIAEYTRQQIYKFCSYKELVDEEKIRKYVCWQERRRKK